MRDAGCGMRGAECGVRNAECGMRGAECGMRVGRSRSALRTPRSALRTARSVIAPGGFEPPFSDPKSDVLPLDEGAARDRKPRKLPIELHSYNSFTRTRRD